ncbi:hypothetical protein Ple7327_1438 [Pleurocapsa sp. PCC 7327]|uniref:hypothetical protein n=1 Tax=Pleurocapsa sp. PCC 7327 TaxID=118163 RepID=UPI00029FC6EB|nr:hypothetical protein [Pleurocapsa sp. PCC 7327]AFY76823.1 hypothetical protein Ple7327_1438 [Pleurocapsa sp. PCC 7327]
MTLKLEYDNINWNDPDIAAALKRYRETIDASSPLVKNIDIAFTKEEKETRQKAFFAVLEKFRVK